MVRGELVSALSLPRAYLPGLLAVKTPEILLVALAGAAVMGVRALIRPRPPIDARTLHVVAVATAALFPIVYFVVARPVAYNGMRHFLFLFPPLSVVGALALDRALARAPSPAWRTAVVAAMLFAAAVEVRTLVALHPDQYVYFNDLAGGVRGAQGRYELDYWGTSLADATRGLVRDVEQKGAVPGAGARPLNVCVCGNVWSAAVFFPPWLVPVTRVKDADFQIAIAQFYCNEPSFARRIVEVTRDGALLSFVDDLRAQR